MLQRQAAGQRGDQEGPGKGSVGIGQKLQDLAGQATKGPGGSGGNEVHDPQRPACRSNFLVYIARYVAVCIENLSVTASLRRKQARPSPRHTTALHHCRDMLTAVPLRACCQSTQGWAEAALIPRAGAGQDGQGGRPRRRQRPQQARLLGRRGAAGQQHMLHLIS